MEHITFSTYKIASKLPIGPISEFFRLQNPVSWREYIKIDHTKLEEILKYSTENKKVYIHKFGCITFVNFNQDEIYTVIQFLQSMVNSFDHSMFMEFNESHQMKLYDDGNCSLWMNGDEKVPYNEYVDDITAIVLAKSTELYKIEVELSNLLHEAEKFISFLQKGRLRTNTRKIVSTISQITRFKYRSLENIKILDRPNEADRTILSRQIYDEMSKYYELEDRYEIIKRQMDNLESVAEAYFNLSGKQTESRLLWLEVFLLALFPIFRVVEYLSGVGKLASIFKLLK